jgi:hypothetical protein
MRRVKAYWVARHLIPTGTRPTKQTHPTYEKTCWSFSVTPDAKSNGALPNNGLRKQKYTPGTTSKEWRTQMRESSRRLSTVYVERLLSSSWTEAEKRKLFKETPKNNAANHLLLKNKNVKINRSCRFSCKSRELRPYPKGRWDHAFSFNHFAVRCP